MPILRREYGLEPDFDDMVELAWTALGLINHQYRTTYAVLAGVDWKQGYGRVELPCNVRQVLTVTDAPHPAIPHQTPAGYGVLPGAVWGGQWFQQPLAESVVFRPLDWTPLSSWQQGRFHNFVLTDHGLQISPQGQPLSEFVFVLYSGFAADEEGLPLVTEKEQLGIAAYVNYIEQQKNLFAGNGDPNRFQVAEDLKNRRLDQARRTGLTEGGLSDVLRTMRSYHRADTATEFKPDALLSAGSYGRRRHPRYRR